MHLRKTYTLKGRSYTPRSVALLQREGTLIVSDTDGVVYCYDLLSGELVSESDLSKHDGGGSIMCGVAGDSPKLVVSGLSCLGARQPYRGGIQLETILQAPLQPKDTVVIQILDTEVPLLLAELKSRRLTAVLDPVCTDLIGQLEGYQSQHKTTNSGSDKWSYCSLRGSLNLLTDVFDSLIAKYKPVASRRSSDPIPASPPVAPVLSAIRLRLLLLNSKNIHNLSLENGSQSINSSDVTMMYCEGVRRHSFEKWPHKSYIWSIPHALAEAGMYLVPASSSNPSLAQFKGDRTSCFLCGIHVYRWEPTDEPWSEHTRHSSTCPLMKGKFSINVPATVSESTHPAVCCARPIKCVSSAGNCKLVAIATEEGIVQVWDLERALYIIEHARVDLQKELVEQSVQSVSFTDGSEAELWKTQDKESDRRQHFSVDVSSLCLVSYDSRHAPPAAASASSSTSAPSSPLLMCSCTVRQDDKLFPVLAVFSLKPKSPSSKSRADSTKTVKPINYDGYDDFFYEPLLEPFPELYVPPPLPTDIDLPSSIKLPTPPSLPSSRNHDAKPVLQANADLQLVLHLDVKPSTVPRVSQLLPMQGNYVVMNLVWKCEKEETAGCLVLLAVEEKGSVSTVCKTAVDMLTYEREADVLQHMCTFSSSLHSSHLLAGVTMSGSVRIFLVPGFVMLTEYSGCGQYVHCTPGAGVDQVAMTTTLGEVHMMHLEEQSTALENEQTATEKQKDFVEPLTIDELNLLHDLMSTDPMGVPCPAQSPSHWEEVSPLQYYGHRPRHMLQPQDSLAESRKGDLFSTKIWQYVPQWKNDIRGEHVFQINTHLSPSPPTSLKVKLMFATSDCINQLATVSLHRLNTPSHKENGDEHQIKHLCGPISIKQFVDVTRHCLVLTLTHPSLLLSSSTAPLILSFQSLFVDDYLVVTEEAVKATNESSKPDAKASPHRMRHSMRARLMRRAPVTKTNLVVHSSLHVTVYTRGKGPTKPCVSPRLRDMFSEELVTQLVLLSCDYSVEEREYASLSEPVRKMVMDVTSKVKYEDRTKALEALCWLASASFCDAGRISFLAVTVAVCRLLTSLLFSCVNVGTRETAQWCGRLMITLARDWCDERTGFTDNLCSSLLQLLPLLQLTRSAASLHWVLRMVAYFSSSTPSTSQQAATACFTLLLRLARQLELKRSSSSLTEVLQTEFQQEGCVLEPDLFDIYLSYYPKPSSKVSSTSSSSTPSAVYLSADNADLLDEFVDISTPVMTGMPPNIKSYSQVVTSASASASSSASAHSATRSSYTIYDSELLLLLRGSSGQDPFTSSLKEYNAFKHGSFLLYAQRGLLETLPLSYSCTCVSTGVTVKETASGSSEKDTSQNGVSKSGVTSGATKERCLTSGYSFPSPSSASFKRTPDSVEPISSPISPLIDTPKELMMHVDDLKPGCSYSAVLEFPQLIALTDISIQSSTQMFAVSVDVWAEKEGEEVRIAQCLVLSDQSLMLGNLSPPPICQYARVTYLGRLTASHEKAVVSLGSYYGYPIVSPTPSVGQLDAVEKSLLSQYYHAREKLEELLSPSTHQPGRPLEQQVTAAYQNCFAAQVKLARFRHQSNRLQSKHDTRLPVYSLGTKLAECEVMNLPLKKLYKIVGCLVDALLILTKEIQANSNHQMLVQREDCVSLFTAFCVNGPPKLHARPCALLVCLCGSQPWWGQFVANSFLELYSSNQVAVFEKERVLLQFSALCQCTTICSDVIPMLLKLMAEQLSSLTSSTGVDVSLLEWLSLLLAHILASITIKEEEGNGSLSLFAPSISLPSNDPAAELKAELDQKLEKLQRLSRKIKKRAERKEGRKPVLPSKLSYLGDVSPMEIQAEIDRKVKKVQEVKRKLQKKLSEAKGDRRVELERKLTALTWSRLQRRVEVATGDGDEGDESHTRSSLCLYSQLVSHVTQGLAQLMVKLIEDGKLSVVPIIAKALLLLLDHMEHPPSLSSLLSSSQLHQLILTTCRSHHHHANKQDYLWSCRAVHNLFLHMLAFEKGTTTTEEKEIEDDPPDLDQEGDSITPGSDTPVEEASAPASDVLIQVPPLLVPRFKYPRPQVPSPEPAPTPEPDLAKPKPVVILSPSDPAYQQQLSYSSFIISAATDLRISSSIHVTAEYQLQVMIGRVYESLLRSIQFALPLPCEGSTDPSSEQDSFLDDDKTLYPAREQSSDDSSTQVLLSALERVFLESADTPQICSSLDLSSLLQLWHNAASLLTRRVKKLSWLESAAAPSSSPLPPAPHCLFSSQTCSLLLDRLMGSPVGCSTLSHLGFSLLHCHILLSKQERQGKGVVVADIKKLVQVLVRYCSLREEGEMEDVKEKTSETVFVKFLSAIAGVLIENDDGPSYLGVHVLMMALEKLLQIREESALNNPNFLSLIHVLVKQRNIALLFSEDCPSAHSVSLIQSCTTNIINLLIDSLSPAHKPLVTFYGAVMDGDRSRRLYYTSSSAQELKWAELKFEQATPTNLPLSELVQLVKKLLVLNLPESSQEELFSLLRSSEKSSAIPLFSSHGEPLLALIYTNTGLLTALLQGLNIGTEEGQTGSPAQVLLSNLVSFLVSNCKDLSCFTAPVLAVLAAAGEQGKTVQSKFFLDLLGQFTVAKGKKEGQRQLLKFIDQGGGEVVLKCLVNSSQLPQATPTGHTLGQAISNLGQQQAMKPYKDGSDLVNFIPSASIKASPSRTSLKDLQSSTLKDTPGRGSSFHHTFQSGEQTLKMTISLPQPILMHSMHIYQPVGLTQNGPSSVVMEVSPVVRAGSSVPLSLPVKTTGLTGIRIELQTPIVSQEVVLHLYRPVVTDSLSLSHMLLLGSPYGSLSQPPFSTSSSTKRTTSTHPSEGWLDIVSSWLEQGPKVTRSLSLIASNSPGLVSGCVSLYGENLSHTGAAQLSKFFLTISRHSPDTGRHLLQHLLKAVVSSPGTVFDSAVTSRHVELLHSLCLPTHKLSQERLSAALKMLPQLVSPSSGESLAPLIRALASSVWRGRTLSHNYQLDLGEDIFKSLLDTALGLDVGNSLKSAINSLLCSLCRYTQSWFLFVTSAADSALSQTPTSLQEVSDSGRVLHTLAQVSQSNECTEILLASTLTSSVVSSIQSTITKLLDPSSSVPIRTTLAQLCLHLSFLTDLCRGHRDIQHLLTTDCTHIWRPLLQLVSEKRINFEISDAEWSFCEDVTVQYFSACVNCSLLGKKQFISLLSKTLCTSQGEVDSIGGVTPFILTLLLNLVLSVETVSAVITLHPSITSTVTKSSSSSSSLTPTHTSPGFHPSYPVGTNCYYLTAPVDTTLESLALLFHHEGSQRQTDKPSDQPKPRVLSSIPPQQLSLLRRKSHEVVFRKSEGFDVLDFDLSTWKWQEVSNDKVKLDMTFVSSTSGHSRTLYRMDSLIGCVATATPTSGCGHTTRLLTMRRTAVGDAVSDSDYPSMTSLLEVFTQVGGVCDLALLLPSLYQSHWPPQYSSNSCPADSTISLSADKLPPFLPPNSFVMLTLCLQLKGYAELLITNISLARLLLRGLLGAISKEPLGSSVQDQVSLLPFILLHQLLKGNDGLRLRQDLYQSGAIAHILHCLQVAGHHQPRRRPPHTDNPPETKLTDKKPPQQSPRLGKTVVSKKMSERQYWAKGTGFGTGSTSSSWDMTAMMAHQQSKELLVTLCLVIMAEYLKPLCREEDALPTGLLDLLTSSCLLPALATCLMNDSVLDISKHVQLYRAAVQLLDSLASHAVTKPLLILHVHEEREEKEESSRPSTAASLISLHSLLKKLKKIASTYSKTVSESNTKDSPPSKLKTLAEDDGEEGESSEKPLTCFYGELVYLTSSGETVVVPPSSTTTSSGLSVPTNKNEQEDKQLSQLMEAILSTGDKVAATVAELQAEPSSPLGLTQSLSLEGDTSSYVDAMRPLQFDSFSFTEETDDNHVHFRVPFHYSNRVEGVASSSTSPARARRLAQEVTSLSSSLPLTPSSSVFVRFDENRLDVMKVLITGPSDTPYANGCFEFDVLFPVEYPNSPMLVNLITTGHGSVRFNPNLYNDGKVCLSVLNTWHGRPEEKWNPHASSFLQVLVSIQSLILVPEPYFNEPGYEQQRGTPLGDQRSLAYNANIYIATIQWAMLNQIRNPSACFKQVVLKHFYLRRQEVLQQCDQWKRQMMETMQRLRAVGINVNSIAESFKTLLRLVETLKVELFKIKMSDFELSDEQAEPT